MADVSKEIIYKEQRTHHMTLFGYAKGNDHLLMYQAHRIVTLVSNASADYMYEKHSYVTTTSLDVC